MAPLKGPARTSQLAMMAPLVAPRGGLLPLLAILLVLLGGAGGSGGCPPQCKCLWRSSKITVECTGMSARQLPLGIDRVTQVLNMTGNDLREVGGQAFSSAGLLNLQRVSLAACNISLLHPRAFADLLNLVEVDLSSNLITSVPSHLFPNTLSLMVLRLSHNPIPSIQPGAFSHLRQLTQLDLSFCRLSSLAPGAFLRVDKLERLHLNGNRLSAIAAPATVLPPSLHGVSLHDNPWRCDCELRSLRHWLATSNVPRPSEPMCREPRRLQGFRVGVVSEGEFACLPSLSPTSMFLTVNQHRNVSLNCRVTSDPPARISWTFNGLLVDGHHPRLRVVQLQEDGKAARSQLLILNTSLAENGSYVCTAENRAGSSRANYTLVVESLAQGATVMEMKMEHFVAVSACVISLLLLLLLIISVLLVQSARRHLRPHQEPVSAGKVAHGQGGASMPRSIQMGTTPPNKLCQPPAPLPPLTPPDLLSGVGASHSSDTSVTSRDTVTTPASSSCSPDPMEVIIRDLRPAEERWRVAEPLIGHAHQPHRPPAPRAPSSPSPPCLPSVSSFPWTTDNPYLHTSGPYLGYGGGGGQVLPDQQYPAGQYQTHHYPPYFPLFSSLAPQYCCNTSMMEMAQPSSLPPSGHPLPLNARQLHAREEGGRRRREERREVRSIEGSSISIREEQRKRRGGEEEQNKRGEGAPPVSAFHVPPKTACQGVKELRGECEGGEERSELESERGELVEKVQGVQVVAPERRRKEEEEEAVIEEELGSIVNDMQISAWTEGTHI